MPKIPFSLRLAAYSLLLLPVWGLTLLDAKTSNALSIFVGLSFTFFSAWLWARNPNFGNTKLHWWLAFMGPTFYVLTVVIVTIAKKESLFSSIGNPILMAFLFFCAAFVTRTTDTRKVLLYTLFTAYFYAFHLRPTLRLDAPIADERLPAAHESLDTLHHLSDFHFLTINGDSVQIPKGKPVLIETWNESCPPCVASINDLQGFLEQYTNIRHLYIYENKNNSSQNRQVFSYPKIKRPEKILMDIDLTYFKKTGMKSYPYFLVYDAQGKLIDYFSGYRSSNQQFYKERLDGMIQRAY